MKKKLLELLKDYNQRTGQKLNLTKLAILVYKERGITDKSAKIAFSRLINGKRKSIKIEMIEKIASVLECSNSQIFDSL